MSNSDDSAPARGDHGWWPYLLPYASFLILVEIDRRFAGGGGWFGLWLKPAVPLALMIWFASQGHYRELRGYRFGGASLADLAVGLASAALWMAPFVASDSLRVLLGADPAAGFDPNALGEAWRPLVLGLRLLGFALVTPFFEELFIRSFVMRYAEIYPGQGDFRALPIARFTVRSFIASVAVFTVGHLTWEWPVALLWVAGTNLWFYYRGHIGSVIVVHAAANAAIWLAVLTLSGRFPDGSGEPLSLWFFL